MTALGRYGQPEEIADAVAFLAGLSKASQTCQQEKLRRLLVAPGLSGLIRHNALRGLFFK